MPEPTGERDDAAASGAPRPPVHDLPHDEAAHARMRREVADGLSRVPKTLPSTYFYDARGSTLFERITELPEYYLTRAERALLVRLAPVWMARLRPRTLVELGAGSASKTRIVLDAMRDAGSARAYVPVDVSADFLEASARALRAEYPGLRVLPLVADFTTALHLPDDLPVPRLVAFLGSTLGNFDGETAVALLRRITATLDAGDGLLLGVDLRKDPAVLEAAYDDPGGVTAAFNRNLLHVLNRELGADFDPDAFRHEARYDRARHRVEMYLVAERPMTVHVPRAGDFHFAAGERVRTEISCKYDRPSVEALLASAGMRLVEWETDEAERYALALAARDDG